MSEKVKAIYGTHNGRTMEASSRLLNLDYAAGEILGYNPEYNTKNAKEPQSDSPIEPVLFKLAAVSQYAESIGLPCVLLLASDVVFWRDGQVSHRAPEFRDTIAGKPERFTEEEIEYLLQLYTKQGFFPEWWTSYGLAKRKNPEDELDMIVTEPIRIFGEYPALKEKTVRRHLEVHASPRVDLVSVAKKKGIKLAIQAAGSDKKRDVSHELVERLVVDRILGGKKILKLVRKQQTEQFVHHLSDLDITVPFKLAYMSSFLKTLLAS